MGTWGPGPFENDAAADFLDQLEAGAARVVAGALRTVAKAPEGAYLEVDEGGAAWAACELVALAFGYGDAAAAPEAVSEVAAKLKLKDDQRRLAIDVLARIGARETSELAALWHEGDDGAAFDASLANLKARLEQASAGARALPKAKTGDVIALPAGEGATHVIVVQVVAAGEVAVYDGTFANDAAALAAVKRAPARRVPAQVNKLFRRGRVVGNQPVRKEHKGPRRYAHESGALGGYFLSTASGGGFDEATYDEARQHDAFAVHGAADLVAIACGAQSPKRVRSPAEREAEYCARHETRWAARREATTPGPFGDVERVEGIVAWIEQFGVENAVARLHDEAAGTMGYGRPNELSERRSYALAAIVAMWSGAWPAKKWPAELKGRLPAPPNKKLLARAVNDARILAAQVITDDAELRLLWESGPDRGAALRAEVAALEKALLASGAPR